jgi:2-keto-3-deoxy-L-rhamnonate aldolase RhmA
VELRQSLCDRVAAGEFVFGTLVTELRLPSLPIRLASAGFDFFVIDMEHGSLDTSHAADMIASARLSKIAPLVRPPSPIREHLSKLLGLGAAGVMVPNVETAEQATRIVRATKYPPEGTRGFAAHPAQVDFEEMSVAELARVSNETTFVMMQIESQLGVDNVSDILDVEGVDAVLIGPGDLSLNLGMPGEYDHPEFVNAVQSVFAAAREHSVVAGIHCHTPEFARQWRAAGAGLLTYSSDMGFLEAAASEAAQVLAAFKDSI